LDEEGYTIGKQQTGIITLNGKDISYDRRMTGYIHERRHFHYAMSMEMFQINVMQAVSELGLHGMDIKANRLMQ
jgi:hypothetical protein